MSTKQAVLNPEQMVSPISNFPKIGISCFSKELIDRTVKRYPSRIMQYFHTDNGEIPIYELTIENHKIALYMSRTGASACTIGYEEVRVMGLEKLILFGTCGSLKDAIKDCSIVIPTSAISEEGVSQHYGQTGEIKLVQPRLAIFKQLIKEYGFSYTEGKVWTTDALYRETKDKIEKRIQEGCICVDMEASAMASVSQFRNQELFHFFYAADLLSTESWEERSLGNQSALEQKDRIVDLAISFACQFAIA